MKGDGIELLLGVDAQVSALGQHAAQQAVCVLVDAPFPRAVGVGKEDFDAGALGQRLAVRHLLAVVVRHRQAHGRIQAVEDCAKALCGVLGRGAVKFNQYGLERLALDQGTDLGLVSGALDEVAFPVIRHQSFTDIDGALLDADSVGDEDTAVGSGAARAAGFVAPWQRGQHLGAQLFTRHGVLGGVVTLVTDANRVGHVPQHAAGLLGGEATTQGFKHPLPQGVAADHFAGHSGLAGQALCVFLSKGTTIAPGNGRAATSRCSAGLRLVRRVARKLSDDGRRGAPELAGYSPQAQIMFKPDLHQGALFQAQVFVGFGHATDSPRRVLHLVFESGLGISLRQSFNNDY